MSNILNIVMDQGSSRTHVFTIVDAQNLPLDLTGYDARMQIRKTYGDTSVLFNATIANSRVAITNAVGGIITLTISPDSTVGIRFANKEDDTFEMVYDLEITSPLGRVFKPARGTFTLNREVTR